MTTGQDNSESPIPVDDLSKYREVRFEYNPTFPSILEHLKASLFVSTYQAGKLAVVSSRQGKLELAFHNFEQAMGVAVHHERIAVGTRTEIAFLQSNHDLAPRLDPPNTYDGCYLSRSSLVTGSIHVHEMAWGDRELWVVNTLFSCLCTLHNDYSFVPRWQPRFISQLVAEDRCHLNGMALVHGRPGYVTALGETDQPAGWRTDKATGGIIIDVAANEVVARGLCMPHSPRWYLGQLWVLDSGQGRLITIDPRNGQQTVVCEVPGYTRGLDFMGQFAFVGLSRIRESNIFGGLPIAKRGDPPRCGVGIIDLNTGRNIAALQFHSGVEEIFAVSVLPGMTHPFLSGPRQHEDESKTVWVVPPLETSERVAASAADWLQSPKMVRSEPAVSASSAFASSNREAVIQAGQLSRQSRMLHEQGRVQEAAILLRQAVELDPNNVDHLNNLGNALQELERRQEAIAFYREAIRRNPSFVFAYRNLGYLLKEEGFHEEGLRILVQAQSIEPNDIIEFVIGTTLPPVYASQEDVQLWRKQLDENVDRMHAKGLQIDIRHASAPTNFYAAYQGQNDRDLQQRIAELFLTPELPERPPRSGKERIHLAFISRHFRNHTIGRLNIGLIEKLPRDRFEVSVVSIGSHDDWFSQRFQKAAERFLPLPTNLNLIREQLLHLDPDVLYFSDVGMDTLTYSLSLSRFAPVQCATWGHPITTGSRHMDYFVSSETLEVADADSHYTERLQRMRHVNAYYYRPDSVETVPASTFGFDADKNIYLCFQNLFKIHPQFDAILRGILERDRDAIIVMMEGKYANWTNLLKKRFERQLGGHHERVIFLPTQNHPRFLALHTIAKVSLDPIHFGGGNTTYEALALGLPVVTWPSEFLRGRISAALYQQMGWMDCVVDSEESYIEKAVALGTNSEYQRATSKAILEHCGAIFEDPVVIEDYVQFFERLGQ